MYSNFLKKEFSREAKNANRNVIELYKSIQDKTEICYSIPGTSNNTNDSANGSHNGNRNTNGKVNGIAHSKVNGTAVIKLNGNSKEIPEENLLPFKEYSVNGNGLNGKLNGNKNGNDNTGIIRGKVSDYGISYLNDKTFSFSIDVPKNVVVKVVNFMGISTETLVDDLRLPGHYVVMFTRQLNNLGLAKYMMYIEDDYGNVTLENKPGKRFRMLEEKEIVVL
jgi:hypothetical protein